ncbi:MAG: hypothetical protein ACRDTA_17555 [Pseudonocardiaceae bacterium]
MSNHAPSRELVEGWLTPERLARYVAVAGDDTVAVELYEWNIAAAGAFYEVLGMVEVLLRNAHPVGPLATASRSIMCLVR